MKVRIMRKAIASMFGAAVLALGSVAVTMAVSAPANADACTGIWSIGMGGLSVGTNGTGQDSTYFVVNQRVGYNTLDTWGGINELNRLFWQHRAACPADHIMVLAHSEGAALAHVWVSENKADLTDVNVVLISDPKRAAGPGSDGLAGDPAAPLVAGVIAPLAGVDADFGDVPVLEVCNSDDVICNREAGWYGYLFGGAHGRYSFSAYDYSTDASGIDFR